MSSDSDDYTTASGMELPPEYRHETHVEPHQSVPRRIATGLLNDPKAIVGAVLVALFLFMAVFAPYVAPYEAEQNFLPMQPPNSVTEVDVDGDGVRETRWHPLGTDSFGRDVLSRVIYGSRISLFVAFATVLFAFCIGTAIGLLAGFYGGLVDNLLMRYVDFQWAFPELILAVGIIALSGGLGVWNVVIAVGLAYVDDFARLVRSEVLSIKEAEYITAVRAIGMRNRAIMLREIFPNTIASLIVQTTIMIPLAILAEAGLSFLGLGVQPSTPTWGLLLSVGRDFISQAWWISVFPGIAIMLTVLGFNLVGDGLRDIFDVRETEVDSE